MYNACLDLFSGSIYIVIVEKIVGRSFDYASYIEFNKESRIEEIKYVIEQFQIKESISEHKENNVIKIRGKQKI
jgi:uncharacterized membrane protein